MAAITRVTMKAMPAPVKARSKRGALALPPEAKIRTAKKASTAKKAENISGPLTEVRRLRRSPDFCCAKVLSSCRQRRVGRGSRDTANVLRGVEPVATSLRPRRKRHEHR